MLYISQADVGHLPPATGMVRIRAPPCSASYGRSIGPVASNHSDYFVSYNQADRTWAEWIAWQLEEVGFSVSLQEWDFRPGSNFVVEMDRAAKSAGRTIAVLSPEYLEAPFPQPEWSNAFAA